MVYSKPNIILYFVFLSATKKAKDNKGNEAKQLQTIIEFTTLNITQSLLHQ